MSDLADLVANLPPGCALWRATGGPQAWSDEMHALVAVKHGLDVLAWQKTENGAKGKNPPTPYDPPKSAAEVQAEEAKIVSRAEAYKRRTGQ